MREWSSLAIPLLPGISTTWFMATRPEAYVDTSALIAFVDPSDTYHPLFRLLFSDPPGLVTKPSSLRKAMVGFSGVTIARVPYGSYPCWRL